MANENQKNKNQLISAILLGTSGLLIVLIVVKIAGLFAIPAKAKSIVDNAVVQSRTDANNIEKYLADSKALAEELKKNNLIAPLPPRQHPVKEVQGILGNEVLINGELYKVGEKIDDAEIVAIGATRVKISWNGQEETFAPIDSVGASEPKTEPAEASGHEVPRSRPPEMVVTGSEGSTSSPSLSPPSIPENRFGPFSPEERGQMRERFRNMSEEERRAFREQMRERFMRRRNR